MKTTGSHKSPDARVRTYISSNAVFYTVYVVGVLLLAVASIKINPLLIVGGIIGVSALIIIVKYPFFGLLVYMSIYFLRLGERISALAVLRVELLFGVFLLLVIVLHTGIRRNAIVLPTDKVSMALGFYVCALIASTYFSEWKSYSYGQSSTS